MSEKKSGKGLESLEKVSKRSRKGLFETFSRPSGRPGDGGFGRLFQTLSGLTNRQRARPLRTRPHKRVTLIMVGLFTTEATIKSKHYRREEFILMEKHMFLKTVTNNHTTAPWGDGKKTANTQPESAFGWVLIGWALGHLLKGFGPGGPRDPCKWSTGSRNYLKLIL